MKKIEFSEPFEVAQDGKRMETYDTDSKLEEGLWEGNVAMRGVEARLPELPIETLEVWHDGIESLHVRTRVTEDSVDRTAKFKDLETRQDTGEVYLFDCFARRPNSEFLQFAR